MSDCTQFPNIRQLPFTTTDGPTNMAADEVLLESATKGVASLRFYQWTPATLSLGYFEGELTRHRLPSLANLPFVRRASGGGTLVHHHEVTYCLALPHGQPWQTGEPWLLCMHRIIGAALEELGIKSWLYEPTRVPTIQANLCFQHFTPGDVMIGSCKIVGSAQRKQRGALMQHGGILLATSPHTPDLPGIRELTGRSLTALETCDTVRRSFVGTTGWNLALGDWTPSELNRIADLANNKYSQDSWNRKR
jgi:lipoate-protein ligase A